LSHVTQGRITGIVEIVPIEIDSVSIVAVTTCLIADARIIESAAAERQRGADVAGGFIGHRVRCIVDIVVASVVHYIVLIFKPITAVTKSIV